MANWGTGPPPKGTNPAQVVDGSGNPPSGVVGDLRGRFSHGVFEGGRHGLGSG